ncbi:MAG: primosomal protein N' [Bacilli bacterium]|nr:primosomal protein N' [Bacilli bacterium]
MIACILVDVKAREVDRTFDYLVPAELEEIIEIGQRVTVPFGPRLIMGYVLDLKENTEIGKLKSINKILDITPVLNQELLELGKTLSMQNTSPLVSIYQAMLPQALKSKYKKTLRVKDSTKLSLELALRFNKFGLLTYDDSLKPYFKEIKKEMLEGNIVLKYEVSQFKNKSYLKKLKLINPEVMISGSKQKAIIEYLKTNQDALKSVVMKDLNTTASPIKSLVDKGIVEEYSEETYREVKSIYGIRKKEVVLNQEQQVVYDAIKKQLNEEKVFLLHGITGSGKTEIYLNIIEDVLASGKEAIMLVPEISLTPMMVSRFKGRFGDQVALMHSGLSAGEKYDEWRKIVRQEVKVVVGARSAIFAPFTNLGIIIIDEEHTSSYKQEDSPMYHAKDVALERIKHFRIPLVLGSATPSVESYYKALYHEYELLQLTHRANHTTLPNVYIEDMRFEFQGGNRSIFSKRLAELIQDRLHKKEQILLLLNRRGHSTFVMCRNCGEVIMCPNCDISLTYHENKNRLVCHYCGHNESNPTICPSCGSTHIRYMGIGTERVEEYINVTFPEAKVIRMDTDTTNFKGAHEKMLFDFEQNGDILLGTQMISKGLDFPKVTLVGVIAADMSLGLPDYKAIESTFQLLTQVSGRAGRHDLEGEVVIQTYNPDHYAIKHAKHHDYEAFYHTEMEIRKLAGYTPYFNLVQIILSDKDVKLVLKHGSKLVLHLRKTLEGNVTVLGPVLPKIARINNYYRAQIIIKYQSSNNMDEVLKNIYSEYSVFLTIAIDKNPSLL